MVILLHGLKANTGCDTAPVARELAPAGQRSGPKEWDCCAVQREQAPSPQGRCAFLATWWHWSGVDLLSSRSARAQIDSALPRADRRFNAAPQAALNLLGHVQRPGHDAAGRVLQQFRPGLVERVAQAAADQRLAVRPVAGLNDRPDPR